MAPGPALSAQVWAGGRPAGAWSALAAGAGLALAGIVGLGSPSSPPREVGLVPTGAEVRDGLDHGWRARLPGEGMGSAQAGPRDGAAPSLRTRPPAPVGLELPRFGIGARIEPVGVDAGGSLGVPEDPDVLGWWRSGGRPGEGRGAVVVDGHVDSARHGPGIFAQLAELEPGDAVGIAGPQGEIHRYVVSGRRLYPKASLPTAEVFSQQGPERLVLISCGGTFDDQLRRYSHNVVVYAVPAA